MKKKLLAILLAALMIVSLLPTMAFADTAGTFNGTGAGTLETQIKNAEDGATIVLDKDYVVSGTQTIGIILDTVKTVTIDLNGHKIDGNGNPLFRLEGTNITICDTSEEQTGKLTNASMACQIVKISTFKLEGGTIDNCSKAAVIVGVSAAANFIMTGGKIINNTVSETGAIKAQMGNVVLCGGEVSGNKASNEYWKGAGFAFGQSSTPNVKVYLGGDFRMVNNVNTFSGEKEGNFILQEQGNSTITLGDGTTTKVGDFTVPAPKDGMCIGLCFGTTANTFYGAVSASEDALQYFFSDDSVNVVTYQSNKVGLIKGNSYAIGAMPTCTNGSISTNKPKYAEGETVKVFATPAKDCKLSKLTVKIGSSEPVDITESMSFTYEQGAVLDAEFESKYSGSSDIEVKIETIPEPEYTIHIPAKTVLEAFNSEYQLLDGLVYISNVENMGDKYVTCTVNGENLKNGESTLTTTYFYGEDGAIAVADNPTFDCGTGMDEGTAIYAKVADWSKAELGTYTAKVRFQFAVEEAN